MKRIEAIIRTAKLNEVKQALHLHGVAGMTVTEVRGAGREKSDAICYRGADAVPEFVPRVKVETIVADDHAEETIDAIYRAAHTGQAGDGRIFVTNMESVVRIRTGETQAAMHPVGQ